MNLTPEGSDPESQIIPKQHKYDVKSVLTPQERTSLGIGEEVKCTVCGKLISFGIQQSRKEYRYKKKKGNKIIFYCKYSCMRTDE